MESFLWHKRLNYDITAILQIWVNTYVNPADLGTNQSRIPCLSCSSKELVFLQVLRRRARTTFLYSTRHVVRIFARILKNAKVYTLIIFPAVAYTTYT